VVKFLPLMAERFARQVLDDPAGLDLAAVRPIRDEIERRVRLLLDDLTVRVAG
jgi:hypothetical protein